MTDQKDGAGGDNGGGDDDRIRDPGGAIATALTLAQHAQVFAVLVARGQRDLCVQIDQMAEAIDALMRWSRCHPAGAASRSDLALTATYSQLGGRLVCMVDIDGQACGALCAPTREHASRLLDMLYERADRVVYLGSLREPEPPA